MKAGVLLATLLAGLVYARALDAPFVYDDAHLVTENRALAAGDPRVIAAHLRPLTMLSFWIEWRVWGEDPTGYRATNILLHAANGVVLWGVLQRLAPAAVAALAAAGFLLHPAQAEAVAYVSGRADLLATFFMLAGGLCFLAGRPARPRVRAAAVGGCALAALLSKESGAVFPLWLAILSVLDRRCGERSSAWPLQASAWGVVFAAAALQWLWAGEFHPARVARLAGGWQASLGCLLAQTEAVPLSLRMALLPAGQTVNHDISPVFPAAGVDPSRPFSWRAVVASAAAWWTPACAAGAARAVGWLAALRLAAGSWRVWWGGVGWFAVCLLPAAGLVPLRDVFQEHRLYLALVGPLWVLAVGWMRARAVWPRAAASAAAVAVLSWTFAAHARAAVWSDPLGLWSEAVRRHPRNVRAQNNLGATWGEVSPARAEAAYARAARVGGVSREMEIVLLRNRFAGALARRDLPAATAFLRRVRDVGGESFDWMLSTWGGHAAGVDALICEWATAGGADAALLSWGTRLVEVAARAESEPRVLANLGSLYFLQGRFAAAADAYEAALAAHRARARPDGAGGPFERDARLSLAEARLAEGRPDAARAALAGIPPAFAEDPAVRALWNRIGGAR